MPEPDSSQESRQLARLGTRTFQLGEGPTWDARRERALWVDIDGRSAWAWRFGDDSDEKEPTLVYSSDREVCAALPADDGGMLIVEADRLVQLGPSGAVVDSRRCALPANRRFNDATIDPQGRLVVGTLTRDGETWGGELFRLEPDGRLRLLRSDISLSNGIAFSPDGTLMYHVDTFRCRIDVLDATGDIPHLVDSWIVDGGFPDGLAVDSDGFVWVALWGGAAVLRLTAGGEAVGRVDTPAAHTTSVAFVGSALGELLITTARAGRDTPSNRDGGVYISSAPAGGVPVPNWRVVPLKG